MRIKKVRKSKIIKDFGNGQYTKAGFFGMIRQALRNRSRFWKPISDCKKLVKRVYRGPNKKQRFEYKCNICKNYFPEKLISVDHIQEAGRLNCFEDLSGFCKRLFVEVDGLQVLCKKCHDLKTLNYKQKIKNDKNTK